MTPFSSHVSYGCSFTSGKKCASRNMERTSTKKLPAGCKSKITPFLPPPTPSQCPLRRQERSWNRRDRWPRLSSCRCQEQARELASPAVTCRHKPAKFVVIPRFISMDISAYFATFCYMKLPFVLHQKQCYISLHSVTCLCISLHIVTFRYV